MMMASPASAHELQEENTSASPTQPAKIAEPTVKKTAQPVAKETLLPILDPTATTRVLLQGEELGAAKDADSDDADEGNDDEIYYDDMDVYQHQGNDDLGFEEPDGEPASPELQAEEGDVQADQDDVDDSNDDDDDDLDEDSEGAEMVIEDPFEEVPALPESEGGVKIEPISLDNILPSSQRRRYQQI
jgi:hypothetical protein